MEIFKASDELLRSTRSGRGLGGRLYPFDKMDIGDAFFASLEDFRIRNGAAKSCFDLQNSIAASSHPYRPKKFATRRRRDETGDAIGVDVVRVR